MGRKMRAIPSVAVVSLVAGMLAALFSPEVPVGVWHREELELPGVLVKSEIIPEEQVPDSVVRKSEIPHEHAAADAIVPQKQTPAVPEKKSVQTSSSSDTSLFQVQYLPWGNAYLYPKSASINGVALGYLLPQEEINGVSVAMVHFFNSKKSGVSFSLVDVSKSSDGLALFIAGGAADNRGCLVGLWNITENNRGVQIGLFNQAQRDSLFEYPMKPEYKDKKFGVQAGIVNVSDAPGIQFGLWNTNPNSWIKHFPLINICL